MFISSEFPITGCSIQAGWSIAKALPNLTRSIKLSTKPGSKTGGSNKSSDKVFLYRKLYLVLIDDSNGAQVVRDEPTNHRRQYRLHAFEGFPDWIAMSTGVFKFFKPKGQKEDPVEKRKAQLRRAQQTYRSRKDRYTRSLEAGFARAQAHEELLLKQCTRLRTTVQLLTDILTQHGIQVPPNLSVDEDMNNPDQMWISSPSDYLSSTPESTGESVYHRKNNLQPRKDVNAVRAAMTEPSGIVPTSNDRQGFPNQGHHINGGFQGPFVNTINPVAHHDPDAAHVCGLDQVAVGMEFVLTIEEPCKDHIHGDLDDPGEPNGHAVTATSQLSTTDRFLSTQLLYSSPPVPNYSAAILDRLRNLSPLVCSPGETTPIQIWDLVRHKPQYGALQLRDLRVFAEKLRDSMKCHGYGAVIDMAIFEMLLAQTILHDPYL
ncbi:hypothetical protein SCUP515_12186 [Seiridium cupressi]